jgi:hypothetical protein
MVCPIEVVVRASIDPVAGGELAKAVASIR